MTLRTAIVVSHPIQHFCPLYRALTRDGRLSVRAFFASTSGARPYFDRDFNTTVSWQSDLLDGFEHEFLPGAESVSDLSRSIRNDALDARLDAFDPEAVVAYGFFHAVSRAAYRWGRRRGRRVLSVADSELRSPRGLAVRLRKRATVPLLLRQVDAFLTVGDCNEAYYKHYGVAPARLFRSPFPFDEAALGAALTNRERHRARIREAIGAAPDDCVFLFVGKLTARKCPDHAIRALGWALARSRAKGIHLVLAGDGPERRALEAVSERLTPGHVHFAGFVKVEELPAYYMAADAMVHPSAQDPHPLVLSEAVYSGLPCIVSNRVGSVGPSDDVRPGENGLEYPFGDLEQLGACMVRLADDAAVRSEFARSSSRIGAGRGMAASVDGFVRGVQGAR
jgi:glycosyltransferase involved in cell wall biosynthesis